MSDFKPGDRVMYRTPFNGGGVFPSEVTAVADTTSGCSVQIRLRKPGAPRFWVPPDSLTLEHEWIWGPGTALRGGT